MLLLPARTLPEGANWAYELKLDGYRALAVKTNGQVHLRSRNNKDFNARYPSIAKAAAPLPDETVIDGKVAALDESRRPSFNTLRNHGSVKVPIFYYLFDVLILASRDVMSEPFSTRRDLLRSHILPKLSEPIRDCPELNATLADVIESVRSAGLEAVVAKRLDSAYEPGSRSGAWRKMRINQAQEFVIGGYTLGGTNFDALIVGCHEADQLLYVGRTRNGFTPSLREQRYRGFRSLEIAAH
jgi:bifunctional non-homologous end joining protein LigD